MERIRKLEQAGVITGYCAIVDARRVGLDVTAFIGVSVDFPGRIGAFEQWVAQEARVLECHHVTGGATLLLKVKCANTEGLEDLISAMRSNLGWNAPRRWWCSPPARNASRFPCPPTMRPGPGAAGSAQRTG